VERRQAKVEDTVEKVRAYSDKVERKLKEVVEQNVSIKILVDSIKTKQAYHERQMSQMTGLITQ
jgi:peptidoglycan hydrolase CwlO-like protein